MSNPNLKPSTRATVVAIIAAASQAVGAHTITNAVDMGQYINVQCVVTCGAFTGTATVKWQQATDEAFSDAKDITDRTAVDLVQNLPAQINLKANELDVNNGFRYVRPVITVATDVVLAGAVVLAHDAKSQPTDALTGTVID
tara:strand:- start:16909 stop:17334 length:426 start_codon:yes stop_codon:yes gene_type:complete